MTQVNLPTPQQDNMHDAIDPLDNRYYDAEIAKYLSERSTIAFKAHVEGILAENLAEFGICTVEQAAQIKDAVAKVTAEEVAEEEKLTKHDVKAIVNVIKKYSGEDAGRYVHFGATSYDIVSTATSLQMRTATRELIMPRLQKLIDTMTELTARYADTPQIGRTHGQHALPITFGFALSQSLSRFYGSLKSLEVLSGKLKGKFSGAVGAYNALSSFVDDPLEFEKKFLEKVDLEPAEISTQIVPPERMIRLIDELAILSGIMANLANDMRHLQRSEIAEIREKFEEGQTGSSTMAHKRNPISFENVVSLNKQVLSQVINANLNLSSEHQRDLTDSASARFYAVAFATVAVMLDRLNSAMSKIEVDEQNMERNLRMSGDAIAAEPFYLLLAKYGHPTAHEKSKVLAHESLDSGRPLVEIIEDDSEAKEFWDKFTEQEKQIISDPQKYYLGIASSKAKQILDNTN